MPKPISFNKENANQTTVTYYFTVTSVAKILKLTISSAVIRVIRTIKRCWWEGNLVHLLWQSWLYKAKLKNAHSLW